MNSAGEAGRTNPASEWRIQTGLCALLFLVAAICLPTLRAPHMALGLVQSQDLPVLFLLGLAVGSMAVGQPLWRLPASLPPKWILLVAGAGVAALLAWGSYALMGNLPLSRDEHMVVFDMAVFDRGQLATPIPPEWRPYALALVPKFLLNADHPSGFVSSYLPMNALLRLAFSKVADPVWFNPLLALIGGAALLDIARRTFGPKDRACWVVLLVYGLSAQMLVTAMTTFSMTGHMALNLVWLAAFLRGGKVGHSIAIVTGFVAVGLHQLVFHPMFVAPFLLWRLRQGEWRLVLGYGIAYSAIILWWVYYPMLVAPQVAGPKGQVSDDLLFDRVLPLVIRHHPGTFALMILNLLRFAAWQNLALLPLMTAAVPIALRARGLARPLLIGIVLWLLFLTFLLPEQGRGYGYRYLSGYLGSFALLAGFGYRELEQRIGPRADGMTIMLGGITAIAAIPTLLIATDRFLEPRIAVERFIASQPARFVVIDDEESPSLDGGWADSSLDFARNLPDLSNRPLRFASHALDGRRLAELCRRGPVTLITRADMQRLGFIRDLPTRSPKFEALVAAAKSPACFRSAASSLPTERDPRAS